MSYLGAQRPILAYGTGYGTGWNLESDDVNVYYNYSFLPERDFYESVTGAIYPVERSAAEGYVRFYGELIFLNPTETQMGKLQDILSSPYLKITLHSDYKNDKSVIECIIEEQKYPAEDESGTKYPQTDPVFIKLKSINRILNPDNAIS